MSKDITERKTLSVYPFVFVLVVVSKDEPEHVDINSPTSLSHYFFVPSSSSSSLLLVAVIVAVYIRYYSGIGSHIKSQRFREKLFATTKSNRKIERIKLNKLANETHTTVAE